MHLSPCPICKNKVELKEIGNNHTQKRTIEIKCKKCHLKMEQSAIRFDMEWLKKAVLGMWNIRA